MYVCIYIYIRGLPRNDAIFLDKHLAYSMDRMEYFTLFHQEYVLLVLFNDGV